MRWRIGKQQKKKKEKRKKRERDLRRRSSSGRLSATPWRRTRGAPKFRWAKSIPFHLGRIRGSLVIGKRNREKGGSLSGTN